MANKINLISVGMAGVDMKSNPLFLPPQTLHSATNMQFEEGVIKTRQGFDYKELGVTGKYHGGTAYSPSRGLSHKPFADPIAALVYYADGKLNYNIFDCGEPIDPIVIDGKTCGCKDEEVYLYQAENYLIGQNISGSTFWWEGWGNYHCSLGLDAPADLVQELVCEIEEKNVELVLDKQGCCFHTMDMCKLEAVEHEDYLHHSHDSFCTSKHRQFLVNSARLGVYAHGRIHQQGEHSIYVSDMIHKRGYKSTDDLLLMEEQMLESYGDPLSTNSKLGQMRALQVLPALSTANGEGELIAYYDYGVVSYNTFQFPRETRADANGKTLQEGWGTKQMVSHLLNTISAVGRYAVAVLPRDHAFRSRFGLHFLRMTLGGETLRDEPINTFSQDVAPILDTDDASQLRGAAVGQWVGGHRIFATTGMHTSFPHSVSPMGKGFVVFNQASAYTQDRTPRPVWEGLWTLDNGMQGIHQFLNVSDPLSYDTFGFMCSGEDAQLYFAEPRNSLEVDLRDGEEIPIEWQVTTGKESMRSGSFEGQQSLGEIKVVTEGRLECIFGNNLKNMRVLIRTDKNPSWGVWRTFEAEKDIERGQKILKNYTLGKPPIDYREASWYQIKVEGVGSVEIRDFQIIFSNNVGKTGGSSRCKVVDDTIDNHFEYNDKPQSDRW